MALFSALKNKSILKAAIKQTSKARKNKGAKADQLFISAYEGYADVVKDDLVLADALYNWGFALLHQAKTKEEKDSTKLYLDSIDKFNFCLLVEPNHLGAAIDGGVAYMDLARIEKVDVNHEFYNLAKNSFDNAERIQKGSAAYNLACICGLRGQKEACLEALELSMELGSLPAAEDIVNDADLAQIIEAQWFIDFMERVTAEPEPEIVDENAVAYDELGQIIKEKTRDERKNPEIEVDGVIYDVEGNVVIRSSDTEVSAATKQKVVKEIMEKKSEVDNSQDKEKNMTTGSSNNQKVIEQLIEKAQTKS